MPVAVDWTTFIQVTVGSGIFVLAVVDFLITVLPVPWNAYMKDNARLIVLLLSVLSPEIAASILRKVPTVDPYIWSIVYFAGTWIAHEILYRVGQKRAVPAVKSAMLGS